LDTNTPEYWDFSFDEMTKYDLPAVIRHVKKRTGSTEVSYVGHSLGTLIMLGLLATQPRYSESVKPIIFLSPTAFISHQMAIWNPLARIPGLRQFLAYLPISFPGTFATPRTLVRTFCSLNWVTQELCTQFLFSVINGFDSPELNRTRIGIYIGGFINGLSTKFAAHWLRNIATDRFQMYDYGTSGNIQKYGQPTPPDYPLEKVDPRHVAFLSSVGDALAAPQDVNKLRSHLRGRLLEDYIVPDERWSHGDFLWALDVGRYVNSKILDILKRYPS
jgi:lysosomal acid lipase/cholesteryl ester hydrolase